MQLESQITAKGLYKPSFAGFLDVDLARKKLSPRSLIDHSVVEAKCALPLGFILLWQSPTMAICMHSTMAARQLPSRRWRLGASRDLNL
ncbi:unnamed protein product [Coffea canephora]|uniref:Uncharacterized protein n=1 Tax=Coffea canephora TaxID=49390 RepID=A0A068V6C7_COFCA|nr:unnamed protein product [Coffea canephora]